MKEPAVQRVSVRRNRISMRSDTRQNWISLTLHTILRIFLLILFLLHFLLILFFYIDSGNAGSFIVVSLTVYTILRICLLILFFATFLTDSVFSYTDLGTAGSFIVVSLTIHTILRIYLLIRARKLTVFDGAFFVSRFVMLMLCGKKHPRKNSKLLGCYN